MATGNQRINKNNSTSVNSNKHAGYKNCMIMFTGVFCEGMFFVRNFCNFKPIPCYSITYN